MSKSKILFIDRDGTVIKEPENEQVDRLEELQFEPDVILVLHQLQQAGYRFVMISNQDGLGTASFLQKDFDVVHHHLLDILTSQHIIFDEILICPHFLQDNCQCRKPKLGLVKHYLHNQHWDREKSYMIGDRQTDVELASNMGIQAILYHRNNNSWKAILTQLLYSQRSANIVRKTKETNIKVAVNLDNIEPIEVTTGIGFFDHMLEQLAKHGGFSLKVHVQGDLHIDEHHTVEDTGICIGEALGKALGEKRGIARYGFVLPMDEAQVQVALDLSGRSYFKFTGMFNREMIGGLATELVPHFFHSLADSLKANLHIQVQGDNCHHMIEAMFKGVGRCLMQAITQEGQQLPSTKGIL